MGKLLCVFHSNCADGFAAAWVVRKYFGATQVDFHPGVYGQEPPDVTNREVIMVDFSYKRPVIDEMAKKAASILIIDHHKTAAEDLDGLTPAVAWPLDLSQGEKICAAFDMKRSGAGLTWDFFFGPQPRPKLIDHIEDRDLWKFAIPNTRTIQAAIFSHAYDFNTWDDLMGSDMFELQGLAQQGEAIERKHFKDIAELLEVTKRRMKIGGVSIPVANLPYTLVSDAANGMAKADEAKMAACYWDTPKGRVFGIRSTEDGPDVSAIAKAYGGGGHAHAAGFTMPLNWEGDS